MRKRRLVGGSAGVGRGIALGLTLVLAAASCAKKPVTARLLVRGIDGSVDPSFGPRYTIERVAIRGNRKTEASLILGEIGLRQGDTVSASDPRVEAARYRLLALGYFLDARLSVTRGAKRGRLSRLFLENEEI